MPKIVKITTFFRPFDLLAPHSCRGCGRTGTPLCRRCKNYILRTARPVCPYCKAELPPLADACQFGACPVCTADPSLPPTYVVSERAGLLDLLLHEFKYDSVRALGPLLAELLDARLPVFDDPVAIVPLPTATHHIRSRGFDHTRTLARHLARLRGCQVAPLLSRARNTTQVGAGRDQRLAQADAAYTLAPHAKLYPDTTYLLLDDISTTGASITAAVKKLRQAGASHIAVALLAVSV